MVVLWHCGRSLVVSESAADVGRLWSESGRGGSLARWYRKLLWSFPGRATISLAACALIPLSLSSSPSLLTYTCLSSCLVLSDSFFPFENLPCGHSHPVLLCPGAVGKSKHAIGDPREGSSIETLQPLPFTQLPLAQGRARLRAMFLVCHRQCL